MKVSLNWIKDYVDLKGISSADIIERLTMSGLEVEDFEDQNKKYGNILVGKITSVIPHPDADKLTVCSVFEGKENLQIVCGAANVREGQTIALAPAGVNIPKGNYKIEKMKIRGADSFGMICAEDELELSNDHSGIMILDDGLEAGTPLSEALGLNDIILEIAITPNRPDALSHIGIARDLAASFNLDLRIPKIDLSESNSEAKEFAAIEIEDKINCPRYSAKIVLDVTIGESPAWLKKKLKNIGFRPINNVVDVTNFVMMETGQPLHAFDLDLIAGKKIIVKSTDKKNKFTTLDSKIRDLDAGTLMICDTEREVAIAGIMGGENSEVTNSTKNILIESAFFSPASVRRTSKSLQLSTDSSYRFERGTDPSNTLYAAQRAAQLIREIAGGIIAKNHIDVYPVIIKKKELILRFERAKKLLGFDVPKNEIIRILQKLGINIIHDYGESIEVVIPTFRPDIEREVDLLEEIARIYGYDKISAVPKIGITLEKKTDDSALTDEARNIALSLGLNEMLNNPLVPEPLSVITGEPIRISNPQSLDMAYLRTSLVISGLQTVSENINVGEKNLAFFEIGNTFIKHNKEINSWEDFSEQRCLLLLLTGNKAVRTWNSSEIRYDIYDLKGLVNSFFNKFLLDNLLNDSYNSTQKSIYQYQFAKNLKETSLGRGGKIKQEILKLFNIEQDVFAFEIELDKLFKLERKNKVYSEPLKYPKLLRDFAFIFDKKITYQEVKNFIMEYSSGKLKSAEIFDLFESDEIGENKKSMAFSLEYYDFERTLTDNEVETEFKNLIAAVSDKFNAVLRGS